jgi:hypothetical protein
MPGAQTEILTTTTLKEVAADSATVEVVTVTKMGDQEMKAPPVTNKIPAKVAAADAAKYDNPEGKVKDGTEEVEAAGKKWKTKWVEVVTPAGDMKITAKIWTSEDVPGRIVKLTSETAGQMSTKSTGSLIEVKADLK